MNISEKDYIRLRAWRYSTLLSSRFAHAATTIYRILGDFRDAQSRQTNSRWIGSRPISIKTPNNTSENTTGGSHLHTTKRRGRPDVLSLPLSFCLSHALFYDIAFMTVYAQCTPKSWTLPSENHANNSSTFHRTSHRNLIRTRRSPIIIGIV